ncbi:MAG TPA: class I SAM-dependent methyltransferase [Chthoniobacterales bacterium]
MNARLQRWVATLGEQYASYRKPDHLLSMTMDAELCFCESYARDCFLGEGEIVDLGCWYGATTSCLARGLTQNRRAKQNRRIEAFDLFVWQDWMQEASKSVKFSTVPIPGQDFFRDVEAILAPYREIVHLHQQDLMSYNPSREPIELLFIDAMKSWPLAQKIVTSFFPRLIPGVSIVVQQDFAYHAPLSATSHLIMWRLRDYFEWIHHVPHSGSVAFVTKKEIRADKLPDLSVESFTLAEIEEAYDYSLTCVPAARGRPSVEGAKLLFLIERGYHEPALAQAERLVSKGIKLTEKIICDSRQLIEAERHAVSPVSTLEEERRRDDKLKLLAKIELALPVLAPTKSTPSLRKSRNRSSFPSVHSLLARFKNKASTPGGSP